VGQGLESDLVGDFAHAQIWIEQQVLGFFNPHPREVFREIDAGGFLEEFAEIERADIEGARYFAQRNGVRLVRLDKFLGPVDDGRLGVGLL